MITLSGCAIINERKELLLLWKKEHKHYEFPGGKVNPEETLEEAAKRECREELEVDVDIIKYFNYEDFEIDGRNYRSHKYLAQIHTEPRIGEPDKFEKLFWMPIADYEKHFCAPNVIKFCRKYLAEELTGN